MNHHPELLRELTPFEHLVLSLLSDSLTNEAIAKETGQTLKTIENTISRVRSAFNFEAPEDHNLRIMLAIGYRVHFGDKAIE